MGHGHNPRIDVNFLGLFMFSMAVRESGLLKLAHVPRHLSSAGSARLSSNQHVIFHA